MRFFLIRFAHVLRICAAGTALMASGGWVYAVLVGGDEAGFWYSVGAVLTAITLFQMAITLAIEAAYHD